MPGVLGWSESAPWTVADPRLSRGAAIGAVPAAARSACCGDGRRRGASGVGHADGDSGRQLPTRSAASTRRGSPPPCQATGLMAAFSVVAADRAELADTFGGLSDEIERLMSGPALRGPRAASRRSTPAPRQPAATRQPHRRRVGRARRCSTNASGSPTASPVELERMPFLANDRLDPERTHGDVLLSIAADARGRDIFALRQLMRRTRGDFVLQLDDRRVQPAHAAKPGQAGVRNLMGFVDGTANLDAADGARWSDFVWVADGDGEPAWAVGGSYHAVRVIRMFVEFWDRTRLGEQEALDRAAQVRPARRSTVERETDEPDFAADPDGDDHAARRATSAWPTRARRETEHQRFLRRGFNFSRGFDDAGHLDQGLAFVSFQRSLEAPVPPRASVGSTASRSRSTSSPRAAASSSPPGVGKGDHLGTRVLT